jgi:hypothetical protein
VLLAGYPCLSSRRLRAAFFKSPRGIFQKPARMLNKVSDPTQLTTQLTFADG